MPIPLPDPDGFVAMSDDPAMTRAMFNRFPSGVAAVSALVDGVPTGMVVSSFSVGVSFSPALVMFSAQNSSTTWPVLRRSHRIGVSVLASEHEQIAYQLASRSRDRFSGVATRQRPGGSLFIDGSVLFLDCEILSETPAGDHAIVLLEVKATQAVGGAEPPVYHDAAFRRLHA